MRRVAISYRRTDSAGYAGRLFDSLKQHFDVFIDISALEPGTDFVDAIQRAVASCDAMLVLIGPQWITASDEHGRRLDNPEDFVRLEVSAALARGIPVIPVLVRDASMPRAALVPDDLAKLTRLQAIELSDERWQYDVGRLIRALDNSAHGPHRRVTTPGAGFGQLVRGVAGASPDGVIVGLAAWLVCGYIGEWLAYEPAWSVPIRFLRLEPSWAWFVGAAIGALPTAMSPGDQSNLGRRAAVVGTSAVVGALIASICGLIRLEVGVIDPARIGMITLIGALAGALVTGAGADVAVTMARRLGSSADAPATPGVADAALATCVGAAIRWGLAFDFLRVSAWLIAVVLVLVLALRWRRLWAPAAAVGAGHSLEVG